MSIVYTFYPSFFDDINGGSESIYRVIKDEWLTIDHINNDGAAHRKEIGEGGTNFYRWLRKNNYPLGFRTLCWNCNCGCRKLKVLNKGIVTVPKEKAREETRLTLSRESPINLLEYQN